MTLAATDLCYTKEYFAAIQFQSAAFTAVNQQSPRLASLFSTQHRWLMSHIGLSLYFRSQLGHYAGFTPSEFLDLVHAWQVASRNTAASFLQEMVHYEIICEKQHPSDRRKKLLAPDAPALSACSIWISTHARTLDALDGGNRSSYVARPNVSRILQPLIADGLLSEPTLRQPPSPFSHFMWVNSGFLITERLILALECPSPNVPKIQTKLISVQELTSGLLLSRSHAARLIQSAEQLNIMGWTASKGRSPIWVSKEFLESFMEVQWAKLQVIDRAFKSCFSPPLPLW